MKKYQLPYGNGFQEVTLPEEKVLYDIHGNKADVQEDIAAATLAAVRCPIASQPLQKVVRKGDKVAVIVSDVTRLVRTAEFLYDAKNAGSATLTITLGEDYTDTRTLDCEVNEGAIDDTEKK